VERLFVQVKEAELSRKKTTGKRKVSNVVRLDLCKLYTICYEKWGLSTPITIQPFDIGLNINTRKIDYWGRIYRGRQSTLCCIPLSGLRSRTIESSISESRPPVQDTQEQKNEQTEAKTQEVYLVVPEEKETTTQGENMASIPNQSLHFLFLLSDSALPLGSFAFSSGLESYLAHHKPPFPTPTTPPLDFHFFLHCSVRNLASTSLPYVLAAHTKPEDLEVLDNDFDASTSCTVGRRASVAQGKALLSLWERAFAASCVRSPATEPAIAAITAFAAAFKTSKPDQWGLKLNAHFAPLFGVLCRSLALSEEEAAYLFLCNHAKSVLSAAVRAGVMGPYLSHGVLASEKLQAVIRGCVIGEKGTKVEDAGLSVPVMDLWVGRHELLYSRIFNS
jgi:urease accessory protein